MKLKSLGRRKSTILLFLILSFTIMGKEFRILTYNIYGARLTDGETLGKSIKRYAPDFVALQEVDKNTKRSKLKDVTLDIAKELGYEYYYFQKSRDFDGGEYGISFVSKYPVSTIYTYELPSIGVEKRQMLGAQINLSEIGKGAANKGADSKDNPSEKSILIINTHLDYKSEIKDEELNALLTISDTFKGDIRFLSGDFNMLPTSKYYNEVADKWIDTYLDGRENGLPMGKGEEVELRSIETPRIDYIFGDKLSNWKTKESYFINDNTQEWTKLSDHLPYISVLEIGE